MKTSIKLIAAGLLFSAPLLTPAVHADTTSASYTSKGQITFVPNDGQTDPENPTNPDPENPIDPIDPTDPSNPDPNPGTNGPLSIDYASTFFFVDDQGNEKNIITSKDMKYFAKAQAYKDSKGTESKGPNFVQVSDNRGTLTGWDLSVNQPEQFVASDGTTKLDGAKITLTKGNVQTASTSKAPTMKFTDDAAQTVELTPGTGNDVTLLSAAKNEGAGTYLLAWGTDEATGAKAVTLDVPGATTKLADTYTTDLVWTLTAAPTGTPAP